MRLALLAAAGLLVAGLLLTLLGPVLPPLQRSCGAAMGEAACRSAVEAVQRRGLPAIHPLILEVRVSPGPAAEPGVLGHRATVAFDLLGVPGRTQVALFFDRGGHWGGRASRGGTELAAWTLLPLLLAAAIALAVVLASRSLARRPRPRAGPPAQLRDAGGP